MKYMLQVTVRNMCNLTLSDGWKLSLSLKSDPSCGSVDNITNTFTTLLPCLPQHSFHEICIELTADQLHQLPVDVTAVLTYSFKQHGKEQSVGMVVLEERLDMLRLLVPETDAPSFISQRKLTTAQVNH